MKILWQNLNFHFNFCMALWNMFQSNMEVKPCKIKDLQLSLLKELSITDTLKQFEKKNRWRNWFHDHCQLQLWVASELKRLWNLLVHMLRHCIVIFTAYNYDHIVWIFTAISLDTYLWLPIAITMITFKILWLIDTVPFLNDFFWKVTFLGRLDRLWATSN